jgi:hypothetical protein
MSTRSNTSGYMPAYWEAWRKQPVRQVIDMPSLYFTASRLRADRAAALDHDLVVAAGRGLEL